MAAGEDEPVPAQPLVVGGVVAHDVLEQQVGQRGEAHGRSGVAVADPLHRVRGEQAGGVDGADVHRARDRLVSDGQSQRRIASGGGACESGLGFPSDGMAGPHRRSGRGLDVL